MAAKKRKKPAVKAKSKKSKAKKAAKKPSPKRKAKKSKSPKRVKPAKAKKPIRKGKPAPKKKSKRPKKRKHDRSGRRIQGGRVLPKTRRARPKRRPSPPPPSPPKRARVPRAEVHFVPVGHALSDRPMVSTTFENARSPVFAGDIIHKTMLKMVRKNRGVSMKDMVFYKYGLHFVNTTRSGDLDEMGQFVNQLAYEYPEATIKYSADNLHVMIGENKPSTERQMVSDLRDKHDMFTQIWDYLNQLWDGDCGWFVCAENDDLEGGSG